LAAHDRVRTELWRWLANLAFRHISASSTVAARNPLRVSRPTACDRRYFPARVRRCKRLLQS
jgi:hypothetical protein